MASTQFRAGTMVRDSLGGVLLVAISVTTGAAAGQKASTPKPQDNLALGEVQIRQLLPLMQRDKNGRISKGDYLRFMEAEFDRLDRQKTGDLNVKELSRSGLAAKHPAYVGK